MTMDREAEAEKNDQSIDMRPTSAGGQGARPFLDIENQEAAAPMSPRSRSRRRMVSYQNQDVEGPRDATAAAGALEFEAPGGGSGAGDGAGEGSGSGMASPHVQFLTPAHQPEIGMGTSGKRAYVDGIAVPFRLKQEGAETASMMTLNSEHSQQPQSPRASTTRPMSTAEAVGGAEGGRKSVGDGTGDGNNNGNGNGNGIGNYNGNKGKAVDVAERPGLETFETAAESLPTIKRPGV